eukprot:179518-Pyramimonas_sp.AAC.1
MFRNSSPTCFETFRRRDDPGGDSRRRTQLASRYATQHRRDGERFNNAAMGVARQAECHTRDSTGLTPKTPTKGRSFRLFGGNFRTFFTRTRRSYATSRTLEPS